jgi:aminopeptidase N
MSSVDPSWGPPDQVGHRLRPAAYVLAVLLPLVLVVALATPLAVVVGWSRLRDGAEAEPSDRRIAGQPGVGDPYFPDYGSSGYDAQGYVIGLDWNPGTQTLRGTTTISARSTQRLESFYVDLALPVERVLVDGQPAAYERQRFADVRITPSQPIARDTPFLVEVSYAGQPGRLRRGRTVSWYATGQEWTAAGEPAVSAWWFPANDHPSDPALMDVSIRVPAGMEAISVGRLESADTGTEADFNTWHWVASQPMATYLNFVSIGQYVLQQGTVDGRPYLYAVTEQLGAEERQRAFATLQRSEEITRTLESMFGPYPFTEIGGVVPAHQLPFAGLENQTRPLYDREAILNEDFSTGLLVHEIAHMWFGNNVTLAQWNDIFTSEAYASWAQWGYSERLEGRSNGRTANDQLNEAYDRLKGDADFWRITMIDPGAANLFGTVYARGPMTLQALRNVIGDEAFFALAREWGQAPGSRSLEEWMVTAQAKTRVDLAPFFRAWILGNTAPARTPENGFR